MSAVFAPWCAGGGRRLTLSRPVPSDSEADRNAKPAATWDVIALLISELLLF